MKFSRAVTFVGVAIVTLVFWATVLNSGPAIAAEPRPPVTPFKFEKISENDFVKIEVDKATMFSQIDKDDDLLVGGVFQLVVPQSASGPKTLIQAVVAVCGYNGILVVKARSYNAEGAQDGESSEPKSFDASGTTSAAGVIYRYLCSNAPQPTKSDPRYKAPGGYTEFWT